MNKVGSLEEQDDLILHAFAHVLGFSGAWKRLDLLRDSSKENPGADTHFVGANAIAAFVAAGGASYEAPKVPVENDPTYGTVDGHWRESVFGTELMTSALQAGRDALSAITIQSLADIGYTVDVEAGRRLRPAGHQRVGKRGRAPACHRSLRRCRERPGRLLRPAGACGAGGAKLTPETRMYDELRRSQLSPRSVER